MVEHRLIVCRSKDGTYIQNMVRNRDLDCEVFYIDGNALVVFRCGDRHYSDILKLIGGCLGAVGLDPGLPKPNVKKHNVKSNKAFNCS